MPFKYNPVNPSFTQAITDTATAVSTLSGDLSVEDLGLGLVTGSAFLPGFWSKTCGNNITAYGLLINNANGAGHSQTMVNGGDSSELRVSNNPRFTANATGTAINGNAPVAKAGAIATPNAQTGAYVQADVTSLKTAIDAIRVAIQAFGITA